jgi:hypothetical protein
MITHSKIMINAKESLITAWLDDKITSEDLEDEIKYHLTMCELNES